MPRTSPSETGHIFTSTKFMRVLVCVLFLAATAHAESWEHSYTVRGTILGLPANGRAANELLIKHEPIPDYRDSTGKVVGMHGMTMPFYLEEGVSADGLKVGDTVEFVVSTTAKPVFREKITNLAKASPQ